LGGGLGAGGRNSLSQFDNATGRDRWALASRPEAPRTPYELRAGFVIPAVLMSGINSDLPGQIMAQVSQNIYDTPTGNHILIPLGSRLVGTYASDVAFGQARVLIAWQRIDFPDGKAMDIGAMPGADGSGYAGFNDKVNNHYVRLFGSAVLLSAVTAGISYSQQSNQQPGTGYNSAPTAGSAMSEALGQQLGQVTGQLLAKNMNISPTLEIRPGYRFNVMVTKDLTFASSYQPFDYQRQVNRK
jgi:type IV secretion system protein VirB10